MDEAIPVELLSVRRQCSVRRRNVRSISRQSGVSAENWRSYFDALQNVPASDGSSANDVAHGPIVESFAQRAKANAFIPRTARRWRRPRYRAKASLCAVPHRRISLPRLAMGQSRSPRSAANVPQSPNSNPRSTTSPKPTWTRSSAPRICYFGFERASLREIVKALRDTYCGTIGAELHVHQRSGTEALVEAKSSSRSAPRRTSRTRRRSTS